MSAAADLHDERRLVTLAAFGLQAVVVVAFVVEAGGVLRSLAALIYVLTVPGWAIVAHLDLREPATEWMLAVAASIAVATVTAQGLVWAGWWSAAACTWVLAALTSPLLIGHLARADRPVKEATGG